MLEEGIACSCKQVSSSPAHFSHPPTKGEHLVTRSCIVVLLEGGLYTLSIFYEGTIVAHSLK